MGLNKRLSAYNCWRWQQQQQLNDMINNQITVLQDLLQEGEVIAQYALSGSYALYYCIAPEKDGDVRSLDISAVLEDTLRRLLEVTTPDDAYYIMGAYIPDAEEWERLGEYEYTDIDLGYVLGGLITFFSIA